MKYTIYSKNGFNYAHLTYNQIKFIEEYTPANRMFTTNEEYVKIMLTLDLASHDDLRAVRNSVVDFYRTLMDEEFRITKTRGDKYFTYLNAMQSVTAVIDNYSVTFRDGSLVA